MKKLYASRNEEGTDGRDLPQWLGSGGGDKFVTIDFCGDANVAVFAWLDSNNLALAADVDVARLRDLLGKGDNKFD